jgi:hypothetical protein
VEGQLLLSEPEAIAVKDRRRGQRAIPTGTEARSAGVIRWSSTQQGIVVSQAGSLNRTRKRRPAQMVPPPLDVSRFETL